MSFESTTRHELLRGYAADYVNLAIDNIEREYPHMPWLVVTGPGPLPDHRELHPVFFGSFDWHSCVEMYWVAVRLLRLFPGETPQARARATISRLLTAGNIATETAFFAEPNHRGFERPYGWGWLLTLQAELDVWDDQDGRRWADTLRPLSLAIANRLVEWLPLLTYPQRIGMHANTAFGLLRAFDFANARADVGASALLDAIQVSARRFFLDDRDYPAHYEPSGADFLSSSLTEAELMSRLLPSADFPAWLDRFLPSLASSEPVQLFTSAVVSDGTDGQIAHLAGLNLSRSAGFLGIARALPRTDSRVATLHEAARVHADASLATTTGSDYMLEHWLAAYATLVLSS